MCYLQETSAHMNVNGGSVDLLNTNNHATRTCATLCNNSSRKWTPSLELNKTKQYVLSCKVKSKPSMTA